MIDYSLHPKRACSVDDCQLCDLAGKMAAVYSGVDGGDYVGKVVGTQEQWVDVAKFVMLSGGNDAFNREVENLRNQLQLAIIRAELAERQALRLAASLSHNCPLEAP
jgi:hypothetical protein